MNSFPNAAHIRGAQSKVKNGNLKRKFKGNDLEVDKPQVSSRIFFPYVFLLVIGNFP